MVFLYARDDAQLGGGADARVDVLQRALRERCDVNFLLLPSSSRSHGIVHRIGAGLIGIPPRLSQQVDLRVRHSVRRQLLDAGLVIAGTTFSLPYVPRSALGHTILDAHNIEGVVVRQLARRTSSPLRRAAYQLTAAWTEAWERKRARQVAQVWAVSEQEQEWFRAAGARDVVLLRNGVSIPSATRRVDEGRHLVFVASFASEFNREALQWFLDAVWPTVLREVPDACLLVAGRGAPDVRTSHVDVLGYVENLDDLYARCQVAIAPLRSGAGTRLKVVEALAHGVPVVSTTVGAEGLDLAPGRDFLRSDDPEEFAECCVRLLTDADLRNEIVAAGAESIRARYEWATIGTEAADRALMLVAP